MVNEAVKFRSPVKGARDLNAETKIASIPILIIMNIKDARQNTDNDTRPLPFAVAQSGFGY
jgi:hypothetical protein